MNESWNYTRYETPPCKNCNNRHELCHSECIDYINYCKHKEQARAQMVDNDGEIMSYYKYRKKRR